MRFLELSVQNYGPYQGLQTLRLYSDAESPILLINGLNGAGKTSLLDALKLALYGSRATCSNRGKLSYAEYLKQCTNRHQLGQTARVELLLETVLEDQIAQILVSRAWSYETSGDILQIFLNGQEDVGLTKIWNEWIEQLLPLGISNLFLFDGEQVAELAEQEIPPIGVVQAIRHLLGLDLPDRLRQDLNVLAQRKRKLLATQPELTEIQHLEAEQQTLQQRRTALTEDIEIARQQLEAAKSSERQAYEKYLTEGGRTAAERRETEILIEQYEADSQTIEQRLREQASGCLPLLLIHPLLERLHFQAAQEIEATHIEAAISALTEQTEQILNFSQAQLKLKTNQQDALKQFCIGLIESRKATISLRDSAYLNASPSSLHQLLGLLSYNLPQHQQQAQDALKSWQACQEELQAAERFLSTAAAPETFQTLQNQLDRSQNEVAQCTVQLERLETELNRTETQLASLQQRLQTVALDLQAYRHGNDMLHSIDQVQSILEQYQQRLKSLRLAKLEAAVSECFQQLLRKPDLAAQVQIDEQFSLSLIDVQGQQIPKHRLSAGEKQLLAIALLWGLARTSGRSLPVAIDTPLGRLDSSHRQHLVDRYFPHASHQVLLFSTDTEIAAEHLKLLEQKGAIAHQYLLNYDSATQQTTITPGSFSGSAI